MKRAPLNLLIDAIAAGLVLGTLAIGYVIRSPLPRGTHSYLRFCGMDWHHLDEIKVDQGATFCFTIGRRPDHA